MRSSKLSTSSLGATAWLGAVLEQKVGRKLFYEYEQAEVILPKRWLRLLNAKKIPEEFEAKLFGDSGHALADVGVNLGGEKLKPPPFKGPNPQEVANAPDANIFANNLFRQVDAQRKQAVDTIVGTAQDINSSVTLGAAIVKRLQKENPRFDCLSVEAQKLAGQKLINDALNIERRKWADKWLFYGSDPPQPNWFKVKYELERQIWAVWVAQQNFHIEIIPDADALIPGSIRNVIVGASGRVLEHTGGFAKLIEDSVIATRLHGLRGQPDARRTANAQAASASL